MKDRSLLIWLIVTFGVSGLAVVALSWSLPALRPDRFEATIAGLTGVAVAACCGLLLRKSQARRSEELALDVRVEKDEKYVA